jgi:hypothetical protein
MLKIGLTKGIGDGTTTIIWNDNWIPRDHCLRPYACISLLMILVISELIYSPTRSWNLAKLEKYLLPMDVQVVRQIPVSYVAQADF